MFPLQELRKRSEGFDSTNYYNSTLKDFRCFHKDSPPIAIIDDTCQRQPSCISCAFAQKYNHGHILSATYDHGQIMVLNTEFLKNDSYPYALKKVSSHALFFVSWSDIDMKLITASGKSNATMLSVNDDGSLTQLNIFKAHNHSVKTACFQPSSSDIFSTGGRDGMIYIWDARSNRVSAGGDILPENCIMNGHCQTSVKTKNLAQNHETVITSLAYQDGYKLFSCANSDPCIKVWDLRKTYQYMKKSTPVQQLRCPDELQGYSHMVTNKTGTRLFASCTNNTIYCYNTTSYSSNLEFTYTGHKWESFFTKCCLSPDEKYLASTDGNDKVYFWRVNASELPIVMLDGIHKGLSDVSWCPVDPLKLATTSDYPRPWIWSAAPKSETKSNDTNNMEGFGVQLKLDFAYKKPKRTFSMVSKLGRFTDEPTELSQIVLPNACVDGMYQTHTCTKIEPEPSSLNNWLANLNSRHCQQQKDSINSKSRSKLSVCDRVSSKSDKSLAILNRSKSLKRKKLKLTPAGNNLTKYFKKSGKKMHKFSTLVKV